MKETSLVLPAVNATLNAVSAFLLLHGLILIKQKKREAHEAVMKAAFFVSAVFLAFYLYYHFNFQAQRFGGLGWTRTLYFSVLIPHVILAVLMVPFILRLLWLGRAQRFAEHAKLGRLVWPVWMFVSLSGVAVYLMLYQWSPA